jgi:hypothetical protein
VEKSLLAIPFLLVANQVVVASCLAPNSGMGDPTEIMHKGFVWPYFAVAIYAAISLVAAWPNIFQQPTGRVLGLCIVVALLCWISQTGKTVQSPAWSSSFKDTKFPRGYYDCARFVRAHAPQGNIAQSSENDSLLILSAFSERRPYVVHPEINSGEMPALARQRLDSVDKLLSTRTPRAADDAASALGIDWLVIDLRKRRSAQILTAKTIGFQSGDFVVIRF